MNRQEAEDYVYKSYLKAKAHQDFYAKDAEKRRPELTREVITAKSVTPCAVITGSKGKGSVANMISQILQTQKKVGLMTSPHISSFCERFRINGKDMSDEDFVKYMESVRSEIDAIEENLTEDVCISPMGIQADLALTYFNDEKTEFNVFECGKGAKYDDVNNVLHQYAVINTIFLEHTRELGETLEAIAEDKSFVISKETECVFVAKQMDGVDAVLKKRAESLGVRIKTYGRNFSADNIRYAKRGMIFDVDIEGVKYQDILVPLLGEHQARNCALAMALCKEVLGDFNIDWVKENLARLDWPGRMEVISEEPFILLDACINKASCKNVKEVLSKLEVSKATVIVGIPNDKDYEGVAREMSTISDNLILTKSQNLHYVFTDEQCKVLSNKGIKSTWTDSVEEAITLAKQNAFPIVILGTTSVVSEVKNYLE